MGAKANRGQLHADARIAWAQPWWKRLPKRWGHPWHSMCSYLAMFPPTLPRYFIEQCSRPGDLVLDPFSGRGTTPLEACLAERVGIGSDANPLAALLTAAKVKPPTLDQALCRIDDLRKSYSRREVGEVAPKEIQLLFDGRRTLPQLLYVRQEIDLARKVDRHILASLCGILHGNHPQDPRDSRTLSISMPNTFSMAPNYIRNYKRANGLRKYPFDVFDLLERRLRHLHRAPGPSIDGLARRMDARKIDRWIAPGSVSLVVTSPPYLRVVRYGKFNWIRLWLLKQSVQEVDRGLQVEATDRRLGLTDGLRFPAYCEFLSATLSACYRVMAPGGVMVLVIGDIESNKGENFNLAWNTWKEIRGGSKFQLVDLLEDPIDISGKVTRIWGSTRGQATKTDRLLILKKPGARRYRAKKPDGVIAAMRAAG